MKITFKELEEMWFESVTDYCRYLENNWYSGCDYGAETTIEVYRGEMLCLTVKSIEEGAKLTVLENGRDGPYFSKYIPLRPMTEKDKERLRLNKQIKAIRSTQDAFK